MSTSDIFGLSASRGSSILSPGLKEQRGQPNFDTSTYREVNCQQVKSQFYMYILFIIGPWTIIIFF